MSIITKNFRLNALANQYAAAIYNHIREQNGGDWFPMKVNGQRIEVTISEGSTGIRLLVDSYLLEPLKQEYPHWEQLASNLLSLCLEGNEPTERGKGIWQNMINDMGATLSMKGSNFHA